MADNLDRFTKHARQVLQLAQEQAVRLNHNYIGTEHLLLGLVMEENGIASRVLRDMGATATEVSRAVERMAPRNPRPPFGKPTLTPRTKHVLEMAVEAALTGDPRLVYQAICYDPLTSAVLSLAEIKKMVGDMLKKNKDCLPQFKNLAI